MNAKRIRTGRRLTALLLCLLLTLSGAPLQTLAADTETGVVACTDPTNADIAMTYDYDTDTLTVSGTGRFSGQVLVPPWSEPEDMTDAFVLKNLVVEEGVTAIGPEGDDAYVIATGDTTDIYLPDSLTDENFSCKGATYLAEVRLPAGMKTLGDHMFDGCKYLDTLNMPQGVTKIGDYTFYGCRELDVTLPPLLESIGDKAFCRSGVTRATIPDTVETVGVSAFEQTASLEQAALGAGMTTVPRRMFYASAVEQVTLPAGVQSIEL